MNRAGLEEPVAALKDEEAGMGASVSMERRRTLANMDLLGEGGGEEGTEILSTARLHSREAWVCFLAVRYEQPSCRCAPERSQRDYIPWKGF